MAIVSIVGNVDKRIVAIPLARALSIDGKTAILTDDTSFKRLYVDGEAVGNIDGIDIVVDIELGEDSKESLSETFETYKHHVYVGEDFIAKDSNITIVCRGRDRSFLGSKLASDIGQLDEEEKPVIDSKEVIITGGDIDKKETTNQLKVTAKNYVYLANIEETKTLDSPNDSQLAKKIASLVGNSLGMPEETLEKLINRKIVQDVKEMTRGVRR